MTFQKKEQKQKQKFKIGNLSFEAVLPPCQNSHIWNKKDLNNPADIFVFELPVLYLFQSPTPPNGAVLLS